ncbi:MAG: nitroreductase family protein [Saccharofermentanales bacterium]
MIDIIKKRYSVRTYADTHIEPEKLEKLSDFIRKNDTGIFGNKIRMEIIDMSGADKNELKHLGTYGLIKGAKIFIAGAVKKNEHVMEDYGYCMEKAVMEATRLGLGTVWLGGFFNRGAFGEKLKIQNDEVIPAVIPIGYPAERKSLADMIIRTASGGNRRKNFADLFFDGNENDVLDPVKCGEYFEALESVRWAPSASNKQPWRIIRESGNDSYHFYLKEDKVYNNAIKDVNLQNLDLGIAICNFEIACMALGLPGTWKYVPPEKAENKMAYIISWISE